MRVMDEQIISFSMKQIQLPVIPPCIIDSDNCYQVNRIKLVSGLVEGKINSLFRCHITVLCIKVDFV